MELEGRVVLEEEDEALADGAGAAKDACSLNVSPMSKAKVDVVEELRRRNGRSESRPGRRGSGDAPHFLTGILEPIVVVFFGPSKPLLEESKGGSGRRWVILLMLSRAARISLAGGPLGDGGCPAIGAPPRGNGTKDLWDEGDSVTCTGCESCQPLSR